MDQQQLQYPKNIQTKGADSDGTTVYKTIDELWEKEIEQNKDKQDNKWYTLADDYWKTVEPTIEGMLGGLGYVSDKDVTTSNLFLEEFFQNKHGQTNQRPYTMKLNRGRAMDCGAGIGRVTEKLLVPLFDKVDLVEQNPTFLDQAKNIFKEFVLQREREREKERELVEKKVENYFAVGLQSHDFNKHAIKYDCIWIQWVIGHLHDKDFIEFLNNCADSLTDGGMIFIKDNVTAKKSFIMDKQDNSVTRSHDHLIFLFEQSNCQLVKSIVQPNFPKALLPVRLYALQPKPKQNVSSPTTSSTTSL
ncbi:hypothetical protein DFA_02725 [Cavenderia fasciculata]|uniref:Alpha N-terminal protein methyltransferase 1 n=1 Tax=Cavenderia fasciculata TaxID=261658 RepID=F4PHZ5_CACFS|nr:uncharacterized protein DFA_02725 [Cavenderia fasciculata]EGG24482.1 hypothetical protein DFA_02725 [Cavenderia fasciculata]|eukprot:XP_004362333.1 hypothetical protein DFA_02725 [Cavenderia fasciculata]